MILRAIFLKLTVTHDCLRALADRPVQSRGSLCVDFWRPLASCLASNHVCTAQSSTSHSYAPPSFRSSPPSRLMTLHPSTTRASAHPVYRRRSSSVLSSPAACVQLFTTTLRSCYSLGIPSPPSLSRCHHNRSFSTFRLSTLASNLAIFVSIT